VADIRSKFRYVAKLALLSSRPGRRHAAKGGHQGFVVCQDPKLAAFQHKTKVSDSREDSSQLTVERRVISLGGGEFLGEEGEGAPMAA
jgi:hypothetical protein